jgi:hypothetical protein
MDDQPDLFVEGRWSSEVTFAPKAGDSTATGNALGQPDIGWPQSEYCDRYGWPAR